MRMELYRSELIALFQDLDAVFFFSQLLLDDITPECTFVKRREEEKLIIMLDRFCEWSLKLLNLFLAHKKIKKFAGNILRENLGILERILKVSHF